MTHFLFKDKLMRYRFFRHIITIEDIDIESYGIIVFENKKIVRKIFDVSTDYRALSLLVDLLNKNRVEPIHLDSIIEDFHSDNV